MTEDGIDRNQDITQIIALIPRTVTREDSEILNKPISMQEVENVVSQMAQGKAPRMDGFTTNFFHFFWDMIKEEVWEIVEESRHKRGVLKAFNATFFILDFERGRRGFTM